MMEVMIKVAGIRNEVERLNAQKVAMQRYYERIGAIAGKCTLSGNSGRSLIRALEKNRELVNTQRGQLDEMKTVLNTVGDKYESTERKIAWSNIAKESMTNTIAGAVVTDLPPMTDNRDPLWKWTWSDTWKIIAKAGIFGSALDMLNNLINGDGSLKSWFGAGKSLSSFIGNVASAAGSTTGWEKYILGMNDALKGLDDTSSFGKTFISSWKKSFGKDLSFTGAENVSGKVKVATKWMGHILTVLTNGVDNYDEMKKDGISAERAVAETVVESAVDIAVGAGATALATAATGAVAVALGATAAPAVVVGAGAVAITWAANGVCKWVTGGKDLGEVAADFVCDTYENISDSIGKAKGFLKSASQSLSRAWIGFAGAI